MNMKLKSIWIFTLIFLFYTSSCFAEKQCKIPYCEKGEPYFTGDYDKQGCEIYICPSHLNKEAQNQCKIFYDASLCEQSFYIPSYDHNENISSYIFTLYGLNTTKPLVDDSQRIELFEQIKRSLKDIEIIQNRSDLSGKKKWEKINNISEQIYKLKEQINGKNKYVTVTISPTGKATSASEGLPIYFNYELLEKAKFELSSENVIVDKVYGGLFGGIIKYKSQEGNVIYLGYGHGQMNKVYNQKQFDNLKVEVSKMVERNKNIFWKIIYWFKNLFS